MMMIIICDINGISTHNFNSDDDVQYYDMIMSVMMLVVVKLLCNYMVIISKINNDNNPAENKL